MSPIDGGPVAATFTATAIGRMKRVYVIAPGGTTAVGGMARFTDYVTRDWSTEQTGIELIVVDSTGPYVKWKMPFHFASAVLRVLIDGLRGRIDLLHINMTEYGSVARKLILLQLGRALGIPSVIHMHAANFVAFFEWLPPLVQRAVVRSMGHARRIVVLGRFWAEYMERIGISPVRITIIRNAVPGPETALVREGSGTCRILFLGALTERKGIPELIQAAGSEAMRGLDWVMLIAGNGDPDPWRAQAVRLGVEDRVRFIGWVDSPRARNLLTESDIFVLPSRNEGLPMAILEAMAFGLPVVATPVGDIREAVEHGVTGLISPTQDPGALADALARLVRDPGYRLLLGQQGYTVFRRDFDIAVLNRALARLFAESMQEREKRT
ncbi:MAG: glycosyl transferase family 1 [Rhodospirillales bacterium]|nr:glycosyl transferase family 1 [Rhodospirillales bacterium]